MELIRKAAELMANSSEVILSSVSEDGYPRPCVVSKIRSEGACTFYVATGACGTKAAHFRANPKAGACFFRDGDSVTLTGEVGIVFDGALKRALWLDWFIEHFPGGPEDPNYCVLRFEAHDATLWIGGEFDTVRGEALKNGGNAQ